MKELQLLGVVRVGRESRRSDGKSKEDYIELLDRFKWLIGDLFQQVAKNLDWEIFDSPIGAGVGYGYQVQAREKLPMERAFPHSDKWRCKLCNKHTGDHADVVNHIAICSENPNNKKNNNNNKNTDKEGE